MTATAIKARMLLADHAQVAEGKLYISGGGWTQLNAAGAATIGIAVLLIVPWDQTNQKINCELTLYTEDGQAVVTTGPLGPQPVAIGWELEVGRPAGIKPGTAINVPIGLNTSLVLATGAYYFEINVQGQPMDDERLTFTVNQQQASVIGGETPGVE